MKNTEITCFNCEKLVIKPLKEYKRRTSLGHNRFFCNKSCANITKNKENPPKGNPHLLIPNNRKDEYTPFRWFVLRGRFRSKNKKRYGCDITVEYLKELWESQKGVCSFTGWNLILPNNTRKAWETTHPANASLDRIDNSKGYEQGNVRFISFMANMARQTFTDEQVIEFCKAVSKNNELSCM